MLKLYGKEILNHSKFSQFLGMEKAHSNQSLSPAFNGSIQLIFIDSIIYRGPSLIVEVELSNHIARRER
jgi:hypothetical protein